MYIVTDSRNKVVFQGDKSPVSVSAGLFIHEVESVPKTPENKILTFDGVNFGFEDKPVRAIPYAEKVERLIREKYSVSDELAILRQRDTKPEEFKEYFDYAEECKNRAK